MNTTKLVSAAAVLAVCATGALAQSKGDMTAGIGFAWVNPSDDNGSLASGALDMDVGENTQLSLTFEYFIADNLGIEVLAATPFTHQVKANGSDIVKVKHLPPTVTLNYHVPTNTAFTPFFGAGVNYTTILGLEDQKISGLDIKDSWGLSGHFGVDYAINERSALRVDARYIDIDLDVELNGEDIGTVEVDPWVFGVSYILRF
ncbi:MAG: OmpW/AlkL family protein [Salipiger thiooxidans]|uniref:OmpW/AlkL family protein n=1 Tax=Salipiger thiooxidans TaxID=282683 RepID=UPI001CFAD95D|nr:OmpW family outer membrane protein [Salipiger thiooxidans]